MQVYKFGGASIATPERMVALLPILNSSANADAKVQPKVIVVSAKGKTTNALERIVHTAFAEECEEAQWQCDKLIAEHLSYARAVLTPDSYDQCCIRMLPYVNSLKMHIDNSTGMPFDYVYDQIVSMGEVFSTIIFYCYLCEQNVPIVWVDVRTILHTNDNYRDAAIDWEHSKQSAQQIMAPHLAAGKSIITQGFIGATASGASTTLGREGSDYTAAAFASMLGASSVTIWKDVPGFLNADPKMFTDTVKINAISYKEVIEMAFYGAQIIHPKTIKPLQNAGIPLHVKSFLNPHEAGSTIGDVTEEQYPPLIVRKDDQILVQVTTRDYSFITEDNLSSLYATFHAIKVKINLIQNAAISFVACVDNRPDKITALLAALSDRYQVLTNQNVSLLTIRHYDNTIFDTLTKGQQVLLQQLTRKTIQAVVSA